MIEHTQLNLKKLPFFLKKSPNFEFRKKFYRHVIQNEIRKRLEWYGILPQQKGHRLMCASTGRNREET